MQKEYVGRKSIQKLEEILAEVAPHRVSLFTGKTLYENSGASRLIDPLLTSFVVTRLSDFLVNPTLEDVERQCERFKKVIPDLVIAVGGGSVIDMAKSVNILSNNVGTARGFVTGTEALVCPGKPLVAIPTTAGTGSEATHFAVVYIDERKYSLAHPAMLPDWAIVDAQFTNRLPSFITATTGMDALSQGIESYWSVRATDESKQYATEAIKIALQHLRDAVQRPDDVSRNGMAKAAHLSGKAINISKTTACHAMSYPLTSHYGIPHGHAVALTLPQIILFNNNREIIELLGAANAEEAAKAVEDLMKDIGLATRLHELGIQEKDIPMLVDGMSLERAGNNPRGFGKEDAQTVLQNIR